MRDGPVAVLLGHLCRKPRSSLVVTCSALAEGKSAGTGISFPSGKSVSRRSRFATLKGATAPANPLPADSRHYAFAVETPGELQSWRASGR